MPSWKKVITSGSDAVLRSVTASNGATITGSFRVTGSSNLIGNQTITGSLLVTQSYISKVDYIEFTSASDQPTAVGRLGWNDSDGTLSLGLKGGNLDLLIGEAEVAYVYNAEATTLTKGTVVYISGSQGNRIAVKRASNSTEGGSVGTLGFVAESINAGSTGFIITSGVLKKVDTSAYTAGQLVYLSSSAGQFTPIRPIAPQHEVRLGYIERVDNIVGSIYVKVDNGYEIGELHDVLDTTTTSSFGDLLVKSGSLWVSSKQLTGSYGLTGSLQATSFTGSLQGTSSWAVSASQAITASYVAPAGSNFQIQYNNNGTLGATSSFIFNYSTQSLSQGLDVLSSGFYSHGEGATTKAVGDYSHAEGYGTITANPSNAFETKTILNGVLTLTAAYGDVSGEFGANNRLMLFDRPFDNIYGNAIFIISQSYFSVANTVVELFDTSVNTTTAYIGDVDYGIVNWSGDKTIGGTYSHAEGTFTIAIGKSSHSEGHYSEAIGNYSHAEGENTQAIGDYSHAEGIGTTAAGNHSHAEGESTQAIGQSSHAEGIGTIAIRQSSHAEGESTQAIGQSSHAEGNSTQAIGDYSHAEGLGTITSGSYQHAQGQYNLTSSAQSAFIIGNGTADNARSNLVFASGSQFQITGSLRVSGSITGSLLGTASFAVTASFVPNSFATDIGNGILTTINITHGLGTRDVHVTVYSASGDFATVICDVYRSSSLNDIRLVFANAPATNEYRVVVSK